MRFNDLASFPACGTLLFIIRAKPNIIWPGGGEELHEKIRLEYRALAVKK